MMISSVSSAYGNVGSSTKAAAASAGVATQAVAPTNAAATGTTEAHAGGRRHVLYDAMMSALQSMGLVGSSAPAAATDTTADAATGTTPSASASDAAGAASHDKTVVDAVRNFVQALGDALRGASAGILPGEPGAADGGAADKLQMHHERHERREDRRIERREDRRAERREDRRADTAQAYSGLADRLEALATSIRDRVGSTPATTPTAETPPILTTPIELPTDAVTPTIAPSAGIALTPAATTEAVATTAVTPASNPLVDAFGELLEALRPAAPSAASAPGTADQLSTFLHMLSQGLKPAGNSAMHMQIGILIDVTA